MTICLIIFGIVTAIIDYNRIQNNESPLFMIRITNERHSGRVDYIGLGYRMRKIPIDNTHLLDINYTRFGFWFYTWELTRALNFTVIIPTDPCDQALERFYEDDSYYYYFTCYMSRGIYIEFNNGRRYNIRYALENSIITIQEFEEYFVNNNQSLIFIKMER